MLPDLPTRAADRRFDPVLEAEYVRARLTDARLLIRGACLLGVLLAGGRAAELVLEGAHPMRLLAVAVVLAGSVIMAIIAFTRLLTRAYLPVAHVLVPLRSVIVAAGIALAADRGELDVLMVLPMTVIGPFFFLGLGFRAALGTVLLTGITYLSAALAVDLQPSVAVRSCVFLLVTAAACAFVARRVEAWSRATFLESRKIVLLAEVDTLTGVKNRRIFDDHLESLWRRATRDGGAIAILLIDVDHFKAYNDRYGHQAGDQTLRRVAQALQPFARKSSDVFARYGGEEFAAVLHDIDADGARGIAEHMRRAVSELAIDHRGSRVAATVTISIGIALIEPDADRRPRGALQLADQALYEAKVRGRNRVELMDDVQYRMLVTGVFARQSV